MKKLLTLSVLAGSLLLFNAAPAEADKGSRGHKNKSHHHTRSYDRDYGYHKNRRHRDYRNIRNHRDYRGHRKNRKHYKRGYYYPDYRRVTRVPRWVRHDRGFLRWYRHSHFQYDLRLSWRDLIDIYYWEQSRRRYRY